MRDAIARAARRDRNVACSARRRSRATLRTPRNRIAIRFANASSPSLSRCFVVLLAGVTLHARSTRFPSCACTGRMVYSARFREFTPEEFRIPGKPNQKAPNQSGNRRMTCPPQVWDGVLRRLAHELSPLALSAWITPLRAEVNGGFCVSRARARSIGSAFASASSRASKSWRAKRPATPIQVTLEIGAPRCAVASIAPSDGDEDARDAARAATRRARRRARARASHRAASRCVARTDTARAAPPIFRSTPSRASSSVRATRSRARRAWRSRRDASSR